MPIPTKEEWRSALAARHGEQLQCRLEETTVAVCGLGGLGSNIAISLARVGIGRLVLIDFDCVDITNLHRQQYKAAQIGMPKPQALMENLREIAPYTEVIPIQTRITEENIQSLLCDTEFICEAFDNAEAKAMLTNTVLETMPQKYLIAASGMAGLGSSNAIQTRKIMKRFYLCGDGVSDVDNTIGLVAPRVMLCAAHQAHMIVRILAGQDQP